MEELKDADAWAGPRDQGIWLCYAHNHRSSASGRRCAYRASYDLESVLTRPEKDIEAEHQDAAIRIWADLPPKGLAQKRPLTIRT